MESLVGTKLGAYRIIKPLGEGGMATVFKAYQPSADRFVAIKVLPRQFSIDENFNRRFRREASLLATFQHPFILPMFDYGEEEGYPFIVMPLVSGGTLAARLCGEPLPWEQIVQVISQVGQALDYAHAHGVVHRDVKPTNILLDERGNCLLTDFGIARMVEGTTQITAAGSMIGTPAYMAPEQAMGEKVEASADLYALGVVLYQMATGRVPFHAETPAAVLVKLASDPLPQPCQYNPAISEAVEGVITKALSKRPDRRYATAGEMSEALQAALAQPGNVEPPALAAPVSAIQPPPASRAPQSAADAATDVDGRRIPWQQIGLAVLAASLFVIITLIAIFNWPGTFTPARTPSPLSEAATIAAADASPTPEVAMITPVSTMVPSLKPSSAAANIPVPLNPCISYYDTSQNDLKFICLEGISWEAETVDSNGDVGLYTSLAFDTAGNPHISYYDQTYGDLKYASRSETGWVTSVVDANGIVGMYTSLVLDTQNRPLISYYDRDTGSIKLAWQRGGVWEIWVIDEIGAPGAGQNPALSTSIAVDLLGFPLIAYYDFDEARLKLARLHEGEVEIEVVDSSGDVGLYCSLALDIQGNPVISYFDGGLGALKLAWWGINGWGIQTIDSQGEVGKFTSLVFDRDNHPHISYFDEDHDDVKYAYWSGQAWEIQSVDTPASVGLGTSIDVNANNDPYIAYYEHTSKNLRVSWWQGNHWATSIIESQGDIGLYPSLAFKLQY